MSNVLKPLLKWHFHVNEITESSHMTTDRTDHLNLIILYINGSTFDTVVFEAWNTKMKVALVVFSLIGLGFAAPQPKKLFHEHFDEFMNIIVEDAGGELDHILSHYLEYDEFLASLDYMKTNNFRNLVDEMEHLPEFQAVSNSSSYYNLIFF